VGILNSNFPTSRLISVVPAVYGFIPATIFVISVFADSDPENNYFISPFADFILENIFLISLFADSIPKIIFFISPLADLIPENLSAVSNFTDRVREIVSSISVLADFDPKNIFSFYPLPISFQKAMISLLPSLIFLRKTFLPFQSLLINCRRSFPQANGPCNCVQSPR
jgi:hypothetical protein